MRKIINGRCYDTATATEIAAWSNGLGSSDFRHCREWLYLKKTKEFFIYGEGGPMSSWAEHSGDMSSGSYDIRPLSDDDAKNWVESKANDKYESIFGPVEE